MINRQNNTVWFRKIFDDHYTHIRNYIYYLSGDIDLAEDLTQDVFLTFWEEHTKIRQDTVRAWLYTLAKNQYFKHHRRKTINLNFTSSLVLGQENESPEFIMELKEFDQKLQQAIAKIPDKTRAIFLMSRIDNLTYSEIATDLKISNKAVEKHMHKALSILKETVERKI